MQKCAAQLEKSIYLYNLLLDVIEGNNCTQNRSNNRIYAEVKKKIERRKRMTKDIIVG